MITLIADSGSTKTDWLIGEERIKTQGSTPILQDDDTILAILSSLTAHHSPLSFRPTGDIVGTAFKIGAPMGLQHLLMGGAQIVSTIIVAPLGTVAIAANSLAITV